MGGYSFMTARVILAQQNEYTVGLSMVSFWALYFALPFLFSHHSFQIHMKNPMITCNEVNLTVQWLDSCINTVAPQSKLSILF